MYKICVDQQWKCYVATYVNIYWLDVGRTIIGETIPWMANPASRRTTQLDQCEPLTWMSCLSWDGHQNTITTTWYSMDMNHVQDGMSPMNPICSIMIACEIFVKYMFHIKAWIKECNTRCQMASKMCIPVMICVPGLHFTYQTIYMISTL